MHRSEVALFCRPHDYDDGEESLALPKEQADGMGSLLGCHVFPIKIRSQQRAAAGTDISVADKSAAAWMLDQIGLDRLGIEGAIQNRSRPFGDKWGNRMMLQGQTTLEPVSWEDYRSVGPLWLAFDHKEAEGRVVFEGVEALPQVNESDFQ